jgi:lipopolysaccharide export system permease protein
MKIIQRYLAREILLSVGLVLSAFIALYVFFDFINELNDVGKNGYRIEHAVIFVLLEIPARAYELLPIAALIGSIYALAQLAAHSEFTIMRMAGLSTARAARMVLLPGLVLVFATYLLGELITPQAEELSQKLRLKITDNAPAKGMRTGIWVKDTVRGPDGQSLVRFVNVGEVNASRELKRIKIYEFDAQLRLQSVIDAQGGTYTPPGSWLLHQVSETRFIASPTSGNLPDQVRLEKHNDLVWHSELNPQLLNVLQISPDRMAARNLDAYIHHLEENRQKTERYAIAFWKKLIYPLAVLVMMALALPFAYLHVRSGGISFKIFAGIMIGIAFYLLNSLFSHLGLLNTWPPFFSAAVPSLVALMIAMVALRWVERN